MAYITVANAKKIIFNSNIKGLDLSGQVYKIPIYFFNKYEEIALLAIQELLKDPQNYFNNIYIPFKPPVDTFLYVYEGKHPSYHNISNCPQLNSKYENFEIPTEIKEQGIEVIKEFRKWFETVKHLLEKPDVFVARLEIRWKIKVNPRAISANNSGTTGIENLTIEELEKRIDERIKEAGRFYYQSDKNKAILHRFSKLTFLAYKPDPIKSNNTEDTKYTEIEIKELLKEYDDKFKKPLKKMLIEYYRLKHNPEIEMEGLILERLGFRPCGHCYNEKISEETLQEKIEDLKHGKAFLTINKITGKFVNTYAKNPVEGFITVQQTVSKIGTNGSLIKETRLTKLRGKTELLAKTFEAGQELKGNIIKQSSFTPFYEGHKPCQTPEGELLFIDEKVYFVSYVYTEDCETKDSWVEETPTE